MPITVIAGEQRGDEGKGRFVDMLAKEHDIVARFNGGNNAGHTVILPDGLELDLHMVPSGITHPHIVNVIGNGALINAAMLSDEIDTVKEKGFPVEFDNLKISSAAHLILPHHIEGDVIREASKKAQGTTKSGIAQVAADKFLRIGTRSEIIKNDPEGLYQVALSGLLAQQALRKAAITEQEAANMPEEERLKPIDEEHVARDYVRKAVRIGEFITDTTFYLNRELRKDNPARVLAEGAQAYLLDIDHGMYPDVTSSSPTSGGVSTGLGVPPRFIEKVLGVNKAIPSHVGGGHMVTEVHDPELLEQLYGDMSAVDAEVGTTTGRKRRLGHLDLVGIRRAHDVNGTDAVTLTKVDCLDRYPDTIPVCVGYRRKGKNLHIAPDSSRKLLQSQPVYEYLEGWKENIQGKRRFSDLPSATQNFIHFVEEHIGVPVIMIGVGPRRDQVIDRREELSFSLSK